jgi:hypothetical protein
MAGINGDLADITVYTNTTPVHFSTSNVPLEELRDNILINDQKLEGWIQSGQAAFSEAGNGSFVSAVVFSPVMNSIPVITTGIADVAGTGPETLNVHVANRTVNGFDLTVDGVSTAGAWTANVQWLADGR